SWTITVSPPFSEAYPTQNGVEPTFATSTENVASHPPAMLAGMVSVAASREPIRNVAVPAFRPHARVVSREPRPIRYGARPRAAVRAVVSEPRHESTILSEMP